MADDQTGSIGGDKITEEMTRYGITCVPVTDFHYRGFRYTNLRDAIAQSKRDKIRLGLIPDA